MRNKVMVCCDRKAIPSLIEKFDTEFIRATDGPMVRDKFMVPIL
jgi:hypothetical protein